MVPVSHNGHTRSADSKEANSLTGRGKGRSVLSKLLVNCTHIAAVSDIGLEREAYWQIISSQIPIAVLCVELDSKAPDIPQTYTEVRLKPPHLCSSLGGRNSARQTYQGVGGPLWSTDEGVFIDALAQCQGHR